MSEIKNRIIGSGIVPLDQILFNPRNWRVHPLNQQNALKGVLEEVGWVQEVIINQRTGHLVDGHLRCQLAAREGAKDIPVKYVDLSEEEEALVLATIDPIAAMAVTDKQKLDELFAGINSENEHVNKMLDDIAEKERLEYGSKDTVDAEEEIETSDRFEEVLNKWKIEEGQVWKVGNHLIYCGDSLEEYPSVFAKPNIVISDPPYGVNIVATNGYVGGGEAYNIPFGGRRGNVGGTASHMAKTGMSYMESNKRKVFGSVGASKPFGSKAVRGTVGTSHVVEAGKYPVIIGDESTDTAKNAYKKFTNLFPEAIQVWWGANYYTDAPLPSSQCWLVWNKETTGNFADCELAFTNMNKSARLFTHQWNGMLRDSEREKRWHPTQKPAALVAWILESFTNKDDVLFDPFGGAGWTMLGAEQTGRTAQVIEKLPNYCAVILERMHTAFPELEIKRL